MSWHDITTVVLVGLSTVFVIYDAVNTRRILKRRHEEWMKEFRREAPEAMTAWAKRRGW